MHPGGGRLHRVIAMQMVRQDKVSCVATDWAGSYSSYEHRDSSPYFLPSFLRFTASPDTIATNSELDALANAGSTATCARCPSPAKAYRILCDDQCLRLVFFSTCFFFLS
jgi:hypothetical protein